MEAQSKGPPGRGPGRGQRETGRAAGAAGPRAPASRSTSPSRCRPGRRTPRSPTPRLPRARPPATPRAPAPPGTRRGSRLRPSSTVTGLRCVAQEEAGKVAARGVAGRRGPAGRRSPSTRQPILRKETEENGRADFGKSEVIPPPPLLSRPPRPQAGFRFRVAFLRGALLKPSGRHGAFGRVRRL